MTARSPDAGSPPLPPESGAGAAFGAGFLLTGLYQLNMMQAYLHRGMTEEAVFEFFVRKLRVWTSSSKDGAMPKPPKS